MIGNGGGSIGNAAIFNEDLQIATAGQTIFNASFNINRVFVDGILFTTGYSGQ